MYGEHEISVTVNPMERDEVDTLPSTGRGINIRNSILAKFAHPLEKVKVLICHSNQISSASSRNVLFQ